MNEHLSYSNDLPETMVAAPASLFMQRYLKALRGRWWLLVLTVLLGLAAGVYFMVHMQKPKYVSQGRMWVHGKIHVGDSAQYIEDPQSHQYFFGTQIELMHSERLGQGALRRLKEEHPEIQIFQYGRKSIPQVRVSQVPKSSIFVLTAISERPKICQPYLKALMDEFLAYRKQVRTDASSDAVTSISAQISKLEEDIKEDRAKLEGFQTTNNITLLTEQARAGSAQLAQLNTQLATMKLELQLLDAIAFERNAGWGQNTNLLDVVMDPNRLLGGTATTSAQPNELLSTREQVQRLRLERERSARVLRPKHPKMVKLQEQIEQGEKLIQFYRSQSLEQLANAKQALRLRIAGVENSITELATTLDQANRRLTHLESIRTEIQRDQTVSDRLVNLLQGVDMNSNMRQENVAVLEPAGPAKLADPQTIPILLLAGGSGLGVGLGLIFLRVRRFDVCESISDLRERFLEDVFGSLPQVQFKKSQHRLPLLESVERNHMFAVACRNLRSSLIYGAAVQDRAQIIMITSAAPDEGKSTVAINLARALSLGGAKILLMDGDLYNGKLHQSAGVPVKPGLSDCIEQNGELASFVLGSAFPNLSILPRGKRVLASGDIFLSPVFNSLLEQARRTYDYVIIDSIPVFAADDAATLAPKVDGVLFVVRRNQTSARFAREALETLYQRRVKVLGLVFNGVDTEAPSYRYYKYEKYYARPDTAALNS